MPGSEVRDKKPFMMSLTTLVVDRSKANQLGWTEDVKMPDIIAAAKNGQIRICSASASQDATALNFFVSSLTAIKGTGETLRVDDLNIDSPIVAEVGALYGSLSKGAYKSDFLRQSVLTERQQGINNCDALVLPESSAISLNLGLVNSGLEPMQAFYINDATNVQIYTIACVDGISEMKAAECASLQKFLQGAGFQKHATDLGFRANDVGYSVVDPDPAVFNLDWGIRTDEPLAVDLPKDAVIELAINIYQNELRPGSCTAYVLDFSPSMDGSGKAQLLNAMKILLDQEIAGRYYLQASRKDVTYAVLFSGDILAEYVVSGNNPDELNSLYAAIEGQGFGSSTNVYGSAVRGVEHIYQCQEGLLKAVILLTDGGHNIGPGYAEFERFYSGSGYNVPVYSVMMGDAMESELALIATLTNGTVCDGRGGEESLARCFRQFKGNN